MIFFQKKRKISVENGIFKKNYQFIRFLRQLCWFFQFVKYFVFFQKNFQLENFFNLKMISFHENRLFHSPSMANLQWIGDCDKKMSTWITLAVD